MLSLLQLADAQGIAPANTTVVNTGMNKTEVGIIHRGALEKSYTVLPLLNGTTTPVWMTYLGKERELVILT